MLRALLSFHPEERLPAGREAVVFPSSRALSERLHGMPESTLRRHLAQLVAAGVVHRRDSPNRKRFVIRGANPLPFGFDLAPLAALAARIAAAAQPVRKDADRVRAARMRIRLLLPDLAAAGAAPDLIADVARMLRRRLPPAALEGLLNELRCHASALPPEPDAGAAQNDRPTEPERDPEVPARGPDAEQEAAGARLRDGRGATDPSLSDLWELCPELADYQDEGAAGWAGFVDAGHRAAAAMGVRVESWRVTAGQRSAVWAAALSALMLRSADRIHHPDAYFRALSSKADHGAFDLLGSIARRRVDSCQPTQPGFVADAWRPA